MMAGALAHWLVAAGTVKDAVLFPASVKTVPVEDGPRTRLWVPVTG